MDRGYNIVNPDGGLCFGSPISAKDVLSQVRLWDRDLDGMAEDHIKIVDESGNEYDVLDATLFGRLERK